MSGDLLSNEAAIRLTIFLSVLVAMAVWELAAPRRRQEIPRLIRWTNNFGVVAIDAAFVRIVFPVTAVGAALMAQGNGWGLFHFVGTWSWLEIIISIVVLDLAIYFQHRIFHSVPALWRLHRMHHADLEFDVTTGLRFHPLEIVISMAIKLLVVIALGAPAISVLIFEVILNATAMFNHSNVKLPKPVDRILRLFVVTPDMHRVHHSVIRSETDSNFGFNLPWWDWLFGTYISDPRHGHENMTVGLQGFRTVRDLWLDRMLLQPLRHHQRSRRSDTSDR